MPNSRAHVIRTVVLCKYVDLGKPNHERIPVLLSGLGLEVKVSNDHQEKKIIKREGLALAP